MIQMVADCDSLMALKRRQWRQDSTTFSTFPVTLPGPAPHMSAHSVGSSLAWAPHGMLRAGTQIAHRPRLQRLTSRSTITSRRLATQRIDPHCFSRARGRQQCPSPAASIGAAVSQAPHLQASPSWVQVFPSQNSTKNAADSSRNNCARGQSQRCVVPSRWTARCPRGIFPHRTAPTSAGACPTQMACCKPSYNAGACVLN
jgi:hypothetical protein